MLIPPMAALAIEALLIIILDFGQVRLTAEATQTVIEFALLLIIISWGGSLVSLKISQGQNAPACIWHSAVALSLAVLLIITDASLDTLGWHLVATAVTGLPVIGWMIHLLNQSDH